MGSDHPPEITLDLLGCARVTVIRREAKTSLGFIEPDVTLISGEYKTLQEAVLAAETVVCSEAPRAFSDPDAGWRRDPASESQLAVLRKQRIPFRPGITKGEASILIEKPSCGGLHECQPRLRLG